MRAPKRRRPLLRKIGPPAEAVDREQLAGRVRYVGSPEHKDAPSFAGHPRPRADASICPRHLTLDDVQDWLMKAILRGATSTLWEGGFPRYVWFKHGDVVYEGRLVNSGSGEYKGWPLAAGEWPDNLESIYE